MKVKLVILGTLLSILFFELIHLGYILGRPVTIFRRGVVIGNVKLSKKTWTQGMDAISKIFDKPIYLNAQASSRAVTLKEIGIDIDRDRLFRYTQICKFSKPKLFCKNTSNEPVNNIELITVDKDKLAAYLDNLEQEFQFIGKNTIISFDDYSFRPSSDDAKVFLDRTPFETRESLAKLISQDDIRIKIITTAVDDVESQHQKTQKLITEMSKPLLIKYGGTPVYIPQETMATFIKTATKEDQYLYGVISHEEISKYLDALREKYESDDVKVVHREAIQAIKNALLFRSADYTINNAVILPLEGIPKTNGELHDVYLELIKSQQRLYRFEYGKLTKTYIVSTGLTWDTPAGDYAILGKQKMTISYFGNWYMPEYLPIGRIQGVYQFGFHAIPYHMDANGNIYSRDPNTMGSPATGGCIQLIPEEAEELFNWARIGIPVYIHE